MSLFDELLLARIEDLRTELDAIRSEIDTDRSHEHDVFVAHLDVADKYLKYAVHQGYYLLERGDD